MTTLRKLAECDPLGHQMLVNILQSSFLDGKCYEFAIAVHRMTGWPIFGVLHDNAFRHVFLKPQRNRLFDARGYVSRAQLPVPFKDLPPARLLKIIRINAKELMGLRQIDEDSVNFAMTLFETVWPELVSKNGQNGNILRFFAGLEKLCKKHSLSIREPFFAARPIVGLAMGDEDGFEIHPLVTGNTWAFGRKLL